MILTAFDSVNFYSQFLVVLILFVLVLALTYWVTKWIAGYQKTRTSDTNMELIESFQLAGNKYIQIIRVGQKYLAVAIGKDSVTMLTEVPKDQLVLSNDKDSAQVGFKELLEKVQKKTNLEKDDLKRE